MSRRRLTLLPVVLLLALATSASAQDDTSSRTMPGASSQGLDQVLYKGLVGNVLDAVAMDSSQRVDLQRTNAVLSNTLFGRSLAAWAGLSNPILLLGGFVWGIWAASNIKPVEAGIVVAADPGQSADGAATQERLVALLSPSVAGDDAPAKSASEPILVSSISAAHADGAAVSRPQVVKIWLPQRSSSEPR